MKRNWLNPKMGLLLLLIAGIAIALLTSGPSNTTPLQAPSDSSSQTPEPPLAAASAIASVPALPSTAVLPVQQESTPDSTSMSDTVPTPTDEEKQVMDDIYSGRLRGEIIARGSNTTPVPAGRVISIISYELEEISLPITVTMDRRVPVSATWLQPKVVTFDKVWVFTVTGGPFRVASLSWTIWLDDQVIGDSGGGENGISVLVYDGSLLREGATIGVSYGLSKPYLELPEKLHFIRPPKLP